MPENEIINTVRREGNVLDFCFGWNRMKPCLT